jgi:NAD(P)H dehydrogenase (quinone)
MTSPPPVKHLVVLTHPDSNSFCASVARRWQARASTHNQICDLRDLYADGFDPVLKVAEQPGKVGFAPLAENFEECLRLQELDVLVFVYPIWFGTPPAMLKGYFERVVGSGVAFGTSTEQTKTCSGLRLVQISTSASSAPWLAEKGVSGSLQVVYDQYLGEVFGANEVVRLHLDSVTDAMDARAAADHLAKVDDLADQVCARANVDRWDRARAGVGRLTDSLLAPSASHNRP